MNWKLTGLKALFTALLAAGTVLVADAQTAHMAWAALAGMLLELGRDFIKTRIPVQ